MDGKRIEKELKRVEKFLKRKEGEYVLFQQLNPSKRVHNFFDNVSEMTSEKNIAMGGNNFQLSSFHNNLFKVVNYSSPNNFLGFRCIAEFE